MSKTFIHNVFIRTIRFEWGILFLYRFNSFWAKDIHFE
jgi:hypothetical protein